MGIWGIQALVQRRRRRLGRRIYWGGGIEFDCDLAFAYFRTTFFRLPFWLRRTIHYDTAKIEMSSRHFFGFDSVYEMSDTTTFFALTPFFCVSRPNCTDLSSWPTIWGSGLGMMVPDLRALGRKSRQIVGPMELVKMVDEETEYCVSGI